MLNKMWARFLKAIEERVRADVAKVVVRGVPQGLRDGLTELGFAVEVGDELPEQVAAALVLAPASPPERQEAEPRMERTISPVQRSPAPPAPQPSAPSLPSQPTNRVPPPPKRGRGRPRKHMNYAQSDNSGPNHHAGSGP